VVNNVDATVIAQAPKLAPFIPEMKSLLASDMAVSEDEVNIKATTTEKLGFTGRKEGIAAHAVVLLRKA
jgi:2-C-methyl-D-erythritol 2,4-cyclodiphosphate synthase